MTDKCLPIAVFDSGIGGVSVLKELISVLPNENFIYFGDTANAPYGVKSVKTVRELTFFVYEQLKKEGIKAFVIACNTATSASVSALREKYPDDIIIGVEPALKPAVKCCEPPGVEMGLKLVNIESKFTRRNYDNIQTKSQVLTTMLDNPRIHPELAFTHCGLFLDPESAYLQSKDWFKVFKVVSTF